MMKRSREFRKDGCIYMFHILELREKIKKIYQDNGSYCIAIFKFIMSFIVFFVIGNRLNYYTVVSNILVTLVLSLVGAFVPLSVLVLMAALVSVIQVFYFSSFVAIVVMVILVILYCFLMRFAPKLSWATLAMVILYSLQMPVLVPIVLGLFYGLVSVVPITCGTIVYFVFNSVTILHQDMARTKKTVGTKEVEAGIEMYTKFIDILKNNSAIVFSVIVFCAIAIIVYFIRTKLVSHSYEMAMLTGVIVYMVAFIIGSLILGSEKTGVRVVFILIGGVVSFFIACVVQLFRFVLDYSTIESVQFEDDDYVYYVRAVPKLNVEEEANYVKKISIQKPKKHKDIEKDDIDSNSDEDDLFADKNKESED